MNAHSVLQNRLSKVKDQSRQLSFGNQRDRIIIQHFAYLRFSPLDAPVKAECDMREQALQANSMEEKNMAIFCCPATRKGLDK